MCVGADHLGIGPALGWFTMEKNRSNVKSKFAELALMNNVHLWLVNNPPASPPVNALK